MALLNTISFAFRRKTSKINIDEDILKKIYHSDPSANFKYILKYMQNNDPEYYNHHILSFKEGIINQNNWQDIIDVAKKELCYDIYNLYYYLINFPFIKKGLMKKIPNESYMIIFTAIQNKFNVSKNPPSIQDINKILRRAKPSIILRLFSERSRMFEMISEYHFHINRFGIISKYGRKNYFPFFIFSHRLFLLEHLINMII